VVGIQFHPHKGAGKAKANVDTVSGFPWSLFAVRYLQSQSIVDST
jgi:hypothetical protein